MIFFGYIAVFTAAGLGCFAGAYRARNIPDRDTRHGLVALLGLSGLWATAQVGYLSASTLSIGIAFYIAGLTVGLATVWAWLYFCFSYTGRSLQHNATVQRVALALFAGIVLLKITNPLHHLYFTTEWTSTPFPHFAIQIHTLHWVTFGLAYALSAVGIFVMGKFFAVIASGTRPLVILVGLTSLPALFNAAGQASTILPQVGHEPIGVAAFAIGILFVYADQFHDVHRASNREAPVLVLDGNERIRTYNEKAAALFSKLQNTTAASGLPGLVVF